jgi:hypothetical protein
MDASTTTAVEPRHRFDLFETGDRTALVCLDQPEIQRQVIDQLTEMEYRIHTGMFLDDSILKLKAHCYDVVVLSEDFNGSTLHDHPILKEMVGLPLGYRRRQIYVLVGASLQTNDEMQAFAHSVDVVVAVADISNIRPVIRRTVSRVTDFYTPLMEVLAGEPVDSTPRMIGAR